MTNTERGINGSLLICSVILLFLAHLFPEDNILFVFILFVAWFYDEDKNRGN